jgi:hypothetical protein
MGVFTLLLKTTNAGFWIAPARSFRHAFKAAFMTTLWSGVVTALLITDELSTLRFWFQQPFSVSTNIFSRLMQISPRFRNNRSSIIPPPQPTQPFLPWRVRISTAFGKTIMFSVLQLWLENTRGKKTRRTRQGLG